MVPSTPPTGSICLLTRNPRIPGAASGSVEINDRIRPRQMSHDVSSVPSRAPGIEPKDTVCRRKLRPPIGPEADGDLIEGRDQVETADGCGIHSDRGSIVACSQVERAIAR